jgi:hypothetical protein
MDVDAFIIVPPDYFFDSIEEYRRTGALFFHDRMLAAPSTKSRDWFLRVLRAAAAASSDPKTPQFLLDPDYTPFRLYLEGHKGEMQESGLIVMDKRRPEAIAALLVATELNAAALSEEFRNCAYGDKESYWMAMEIVRAPYAFSGRYAGNMGTIDWSPWTGWVGVCGGTMVHLVRSQSKRLLWFNGGLIRLKYHPESTTWNETARWDVWTIDGPWLLTMEYYCMRCQFGGVFQWLPGMRSLFGTHVRRIQQSDKRVLDQLLSIDEQVKSTLKFNL